MATEATQTENPFFKHDLIVLIGGAALVLVGVLAQGGRTKVSFTSFSRDGLTVPYPQSPKWSGPTSESYPARIESSQCSTDPKMACNDTPTAQIVVRNYDDAMGLGEAQAGKDHDAAYGDRAKRIVSPEATRKIGDKEWKCTTFAYVPVGARTETMAEECTIVNNKKLYVVTLSGPEKYVKQLDPDTMGKLVLQ
jgi:hypothetical protein